MSSSCTSLRPPTADEAYLKSQGICHFPEAWPNDSYRLIGYGRKVIEVNQRNLIYHYLPVCNDNHYRLPEKPDISSLN